MSPRLNAAVSTEVEDQGQGTRSTPPTVAPSIAGRFQLNPILAETGAEAIAAQAEAVEACRLA